MAAGEWRERHLRAAAAAAPSLTMPAHVLMMWFPSCSTRVVSSFSVPCQAGDGMVLAEDPG
jgi:hypothetical protein